jgi:hypothetical protein
MNSMKNQIHEELAAITSKAEGWAEDTLPEMYKTGITETNAFLTKAYKTAGQIAPGFPDAFAVIHREALNVLINKTTITLNMAIEGAGRRLDDAIRAAGQEAIKTKIVTGSTVTKTKKILVEKLKAEGLKVIPKKDGSSISLEAYGELVARSTTREATNLGSITQVQAVGGDLVKMTEHYPTCPVCLPLQGRVYSISGTSKEYPPLGRAYTGQYANIHPNCRHVLNPYIPEFKTPEELEADKKKSQMSFDTDQWPDPARKKAEASLRAYNKDQAFKAKRWKQKQEYKALKAAFPEEAPGSFAGYLSSAKHKGPKWKALEEAKLTKGKLIDIQKKEYIVMQDFGKRLRGFDTAAEADDYIKQLKAAGIPGRFSKISGPTYLSEVKGGYAPKPEGIIRLAPKKAAKEVVKKTDDAAKAALEAKKSSATMKAARVTDTLDDKTIIKAAEREAGIKPSYNHEDIPTLKNLKKTQDEMVERLKNPTGNVDGQEFDIGKRLRDPQAQEIYNERLTEAMKNSDVHTRTSTDSLFKILEDGRFKSQMETGTSRGALDPSYRKEVSYKLFGTPAGTADDAYEIYGYMGTKDLVDETFGYMGVEHYGEVIIKFKPTIRSRTTITVGDSLGLPGYGKTKCVGQLLDQPFKTINGEIFDMDDIIYSKDAVAKFANKGYNARAITEVSRASYVEAQLHGGVLVDDIAEVMLDRTTISSSKYIEGDWKRLIEDLNSRGIDVTVKHRNPDYGPESTIEFIFEKFPGK